jgi:hypothetical protein
MFEMIRKVLLAKARFTQSPVIPFLGTWPPNEVLSDAVRSLTVDDLR